MIDLRLTDKHGQLLQKVLEERVAETEVKALLSEVLEQIEQSRFHPDRSMYCNTCGEEIEERDLGADMVCPHCEASIEDE
jgi:rubrerythrin